MQPPLYAASVPVFLHFIDRLEGLLSLVEGREELLSARLAPDMFGLAQQAATAIAFALRTACPLAGRAVPALDEPPMHLPGLRARIRDARIVLTALPPEAFAGAETRRIRHRAGFAQLDQDGAAFLHLFGMPNMLFHLSMVFAILRANGVEVGKADFDALHDYPHGFRF